jgi:serine/threonine protein phosphatase PrpC
MNRCPQCQAEYAKGDRFCADCGVKLSAPLADAPGAIAACACGSTSFDADGFCMECGVRKIAAPAREGAIIVGPGLAAFTDAGLVHDRNEDACVVTGPTSGGVGAILVVSDGVSNSQAPDVASAVAARAALASLQAGLAAGIGAEQAVHDAVVRAHDTVCEVPYDRQNPVDPPAATIAIAVVGAAEAGGRSVTIGWLGDTRVYWIARGEKSGGGGRLLTRDHSWRNLVVDRGEMTDEAARQDRLAHALVKCLGSTDFTAPTPCPDPTVATVVLPAEGWLLACTDGLWNYAESPPSLAAAAQGAFWTRDAVGICERLVAFARSRGGRDNITAAVAGLA